MTFPLKLKYKTKISALPIIQMIGMPLIAEVSTAALSISAMVLSQCKLDTN